MSTANIAENMGEISDIVDAVLNLQNTTFVTGENIRVEGGVHASR